MFVAPRTPGTKSVPDMIKSDDLAVENWKTCWISSTQFQDLLMEERHTTNTRTDQQLVAITCYKKVV